jgi:outer membrane autotransporter protein
MRPYVSATATTRFDIGAQTRIEPQVRLAYEVEALNSPGISVDPTADDYTFRYPGVTPSRGRFSVSAGATIEKTRALDFFTDAGLLQAGNTRGAQFDAGVRYLF